LAAYLVVHNPGDEYTPGRGQSLQPSGNVHRLAVDLPTLVKHVTQVNAQPETHAVLPRKPTVGGPQPLLYVQRASHSRQGAVEHSQKAVAGHVNHLPSALRHLLGYKPAVAVDGSCRFDVIAAHQPAEVLYVGAKDGASFSCKFLLFHDDPLS